MRLKLYRGKWNVVGNDGGRIWRRSLGTTDRAVAERRFRDLRFETPGDSIGDAVDLYLKEKSGRRSYQSMLTCWRALKPLFGHLRPDQVTRELCREYSGRRRKAGVQDGTIIKDLGMLKAALRFVNKGAAAVFEMPSAPPPRERYIDRGEWQALVDAAALPHLKLFITLAWSTAARASALYELEWSQVDFNRGKHGQIRLSKGQARQKGRSTVPITAAARAALDEAHRARTCDYVIEWGGKPVKSVKRAFEEACRRAGLVDVTPHTLRHSAAVAMAEAGVPMHEIAAYLGHTDPRVTFRVYARFSPEHLRRAAAALE